MVMLSVQPYEGLAMTTRFKSKFRVVCFRYWAPNGGCNAEILGQKLCHDYEEVLEFVNKRAREWHKECEIKSKFEEFTLRPEQGAAAECLPELRKFGNTKDYGFMAALQTCAYTGDEIYESLYEAYDHRFNQGQPANR